MARPSKDESPEHQRLTRQVEQAFARGQAAFAQAGLARSGSARGGLASGDRKEALRWLDRAHRLAPADGTIALVLASATLGHDNPAAAALFREVLEHADVRDAFLGLATAGFLTGDWLAARNALADMLSRHALRPDVHALAERIARETGAPGWCGMTGASEMVVRPVGAGPVSVSIDGTALACGPSGDFPLPAAWPRSRSVTAMIGDRHLIGSPISLRAIGRVEGEVEAWEGGLRGWAWCPADPDADPGLVVSVRRARTNIAMAEPAMGIPSLAPLAQPRAFAISWKDLPAGARAGRVRGRDGRELSARPAGEAVVDRPAGRQPQFVNRHPRGVERQPLVVERRPRARPEDHSTRQGIQKSDKVSGLADPRVEPEDDGVGSTADLARAPSSAVILITHDDGGGVERRIQTAIASHTAVILITHDDGGGVERRIQTAIASHTASGRRVIVLRPTKAGDGPIGVIAEAQGQPSTRFELPRQHAALLRLLRVANPGEIELHHFLNHDPSVFGILQAPGVPYDVHTHDYAWFCPRIALVGRANRYCGEPAVSVCETCVAKAGTYLHEPISVADLLQRSHAILRGARRVVSPSHDAAARMARHFPGLSPIVIPHEDDAAIEDPPPIPVVSGTVRICIAGAIGLHKGYDVLLACARDARKRKLELEFVVAGTTTNDERLMDTGRVFVTGPYRPDEAIALIRAQDAALALLPSIWPETWCLGLTELWRAGLRVAAFDTGAPAERIRRTGRGFLLPLGLPAGAINDTLLNAARGRSFLPIRRSSAYKPSTLMQP